MNARQVLWSVSAAAALASFGASAQIVVGQTAGFSGVVAAGVKETTDGARLYLDSVNEQGGVNGQKIELVSLDDKFEPKLAAENARKLITEHKVITLFLTRGTPHTQAIVPLLAEYKVPLVAPSTGAMVLHQPVNPMIFNVRATYQREAERAIRHLSLIGLERIAILQVDDTFGADAVQGAQKGFEAVGKQPLLLEKFDRAKPDYSVAAPKIAKADAQAVLFIGSGAAVADGAKALRDAGSRAQIVTLSNNASGGFIKQLGDNARGTIVTQVFPYERSLSAPIVKEAVDLMRAKGGAEVSPAMMEGFAAAKVLVEGLRRAGANPTREKLVTALNGIRKLDIGGMEVSFSPGDHTGLDYADLSIIGQDGKFRR
ncbi:ABC transporter substrate-binding protein [Methylibium rhizosphaerae]|uniref:ABC transporter substrate-binding protein n=1 Tax=Methylibium rhizosphaerae TaxID=2570323 RepID=UPI00112C5974|nr:ABC transporter substrate-binding protein [Methylibium rhizosphaerae]